MKKNILLIFIVFLVFPISVYAENQVINGNDFDIYKRSKEDIFSKWESSKLNIPNNYNDIYERLPNYNAPYKAGIVKQNYLNSVINNLNYYRYLTGSPEIIEPTSNDNELQTAEVVQNAYVNATGNITHNIGDNWTKPNDMTTEFWNLGINANHNIISYNLVKDPNYSFFDESIFDDDYPEAGHRLALLVPSLNKVDYGIGNKVIYGRNTLSINRYDEMDNTFAAYPSPGFFPKEDFANKSDWDIYLNTNNFYILDDESFQEEVLVTIKNLETEEIETRSISDNTLVFDYSCNEKYCNNNYNVLHIKQPSKSTNYYNGSYEVTVKNLINRSNQLVDIKYTVNFYDKYEVSETNVADANFDLYLGGIYYDGVYNNSLINEAIEDNNMNLELESGYNYELKVNNYDIRYDKRYSNYDKYNAFPIYDDLPSWIKDNDNIVSNTTMPIYGLYSENSYKFNYKEIEYNKYVGDSVTLSINGLDSGIDEDYDTFLWIKEKDGVYSILDDEEKYSLSSDGLNLTINNLSSDDSANYYVTVLTTYEDYYDSYYFLSKPLVLNVNKKVENINFEDEVLNIIVNTTKKLEPTITPVDSMYTLNWSSSDESVVTVDENGNIRGLKKGSATITVTTNNNLSASINIIVNDYIKGDMNGNGKIDLKDIIMLIKKYLINSVIPEDISIGDMNNNNVLDLKDIILLIKLYLE